MRVRDCAHPGLTCVLTAWCRCAKGSSSSSRRAAPPPRARPTCLRNFLPLNTQLLNGLLLTRRTASGTSASSRRSSTSRGCRSSSRCSDSMHMLVGTDHGAMLPYTIAPSCHHAIWPSCHHASTAIHPSVGARQGGRARRHRAAQGRVPAALRVPHVRACVRVVRSEFGCG